MTNACPRHAPADDNPPPSGWLSRAFDKTSGWAGPAAAAFFTFKGCCIVPKLILIATGAATTATAGFGALSFAFSVAAAGGGLYFWNRLRGKQAGKWEKRIVIGATVISLGWAAHRQFTPHNDCCHPGQECTAPGHDKDQILCKPPSR